MEVDNYTDPNEKGIISAQVSESEGSFLNDFELETYQTIYKKLLDGDQNDRKEEGEKDICTQDSRTENKNVDRRLLMYLKQLLEFPLKTLEFETALVKGEIEQNSAEITDLFYKEFNGNDKKHFESQLEGMKDDKTPESEQTSYIEKEKERSPEYTKGNDGMLFSDLKNLYQDIKESRVKINKGLERIKQRVPEVKDQSDKLIEYSTKIREGRNISRRLLEKVENIIFFAEIPKTMRQFGSSGKYQEVIDIYEGTKQFYEEFKTHYLLETMKRSGAKGSYKGEAEQGSIDAIKREQELRMMYLQVQWQGWKTTSELIGFNIDQYMSEIDEEGVELGKIFGENTRRSSGQQQQQWVRSEIFSPQRTSMQSPGFYSPRIQPLGSPFGMSEGGVTGTKGMDIFRARRNVGHADSGEKKACKMLDSLMSHSIQTTITVIRENLVYLRNDETTLLSILEQSGWLSEKLGSVVGSDNGRVLNFVGAVLVPDIIDMIFAIMVRNLQSSVESTSVCLREIIKDVVGKVEEVFGDVVKENIEAIGKENLEKKKYESSIEIIKRCGISGDPDDDRKLKSVAGYLLDMPWIRITNFPTPTNYHKNIEGSAASGEEEIPAVVPGFLGDEVKLKEYFICNEKRHKLRSSIFAGSQPSESGDQPFPKKSDVLQYQLMSILQNSVNKYVASLGSLLSYIKNTGDATRSGSVPSGRILFGNRLQSEIFRAKLVNFALSVLEYELFKVAEHWLWLYKFINSIWAFSNSNSNSNSNSESKDATNISSVSDIHFMITECYLIYLFGLVDSALDSFNEIK
ncbi:hypothetical protein AX774_g4895 [Zancudomyces culisetae]|uniref:Exocyst complex component SEC5 n=1 Tax=Zancudomyces culisetae TaxID=1213189 RepID=A0A1R1PKZ5_ZANCU|nr:hypothetical protein AX774_g4895 [Zancudomyces culisetae]|eukprot:OMH81648.1 hypothetical protein AX774_g4895 [Zancudomyces culisetae]